MDFNFSHLVGVPYESKHCWQLTVDFYKDWKNISLHHIFDGEVPSRPETKDLIYSNVGEFEQVAGAPNFGDIIIMRVLGVESHIAVYVGNGKMLHTSKRVGSVIESVEKWKKIVVGFYRVKKND